MKIAIFGNKETTSRLIEVLGENNIYCNALIKLNDVSASKIEIAGKSNQLCITAESYGLEIYNAESYQLNSKADLLFFKQNNFDLGISTGWQRLIPDTVLNTFKIGVFGWHGSGFEFPNGRGRSPLNWTIRLGLSRIFHNCFKYAAGADNGPVFETKVIEILDSDQISDIQNKAFFHIADSAKRLVKQASENNLNLISQPEYPSIMLPALTKESGEIFPTIMTVRAIINLIRSCSKPFPGAFVKQSDGNIIRIWSAERCKIEDNEGNKEIGSATFNESFITIQCLDGAILSRDFEVHP
jgi:UDP-4-amino-4-deoxy-L-arabinose formyltransferase/UDP-glucuronic acid dehydrogenase (UDP-4-keto-hexauronic acid decarboxylating)